MLVKHILKQGLLIKNAGVLSRAAYHGGHHQHSTLDDLPVPAGDWKENYARQNAKYNAWLAAGVLFLAGTIGFVKTSGVIELNNKVPQSLD
ncbi:uncharacterized protein LOC101450794 [Ceratitis capitata]|uniref:(Mediterranean fruit fly) hypothetical protein n=1 Tax=Ceratitis capitata TaxID=7213 RepID=A0A811UWH7_CERCA|nr:uncharacterized protein LOC101450794 [Ceratitis capitata]CAD7003582.1 unnamed protein product [Ceratitis capitata]